MRAVGVLASALSCSRGMIFESRESCSLAVTRKANPGSE